MLILLAALSFAEPPAPALPALVASEPAEADTKALEAEFAPLRAQMTALAGSDATWRATAPVEPDALPDAIQWEVGRLLAPGLLHPERLALAPAPAPGAAPKKAPKKQQVEMAMEADAWSDYRVRFASGDPGKVEAVSYTHHEVQYGRGVFVTDHEVLVTYGDREIRVFARQKGSMDNTPTAYETLVVLRLDASGNVAGATIKRLNDEVDYSTPTPKAEPPVVKKGTVSTFS